MRMQDFVESYRLKTDEELLQFAAHPEQLTADALSALRGEMALRRLNASPTTSDLAREASFSARNSIPESSQDSFGAKAFLVDVFQLYHAHFLLFFKLAFPTVLVSYAALIGSQNIVHQLSREIVHRGWSFHASSGTIVEMSLVRLTGFVTSWFAFCYMFAATCTALAEFLNGATPSVRECLKAVNKHLPAFFRISILLFCLFAVLTAIVGVVDTGVFSTLYRFDWKLRGLLWWCTAIGSGAVSIVIFSRFSLAIPTVVLGDYTAKMALFRSDELTEGKWTVLAALVVKSLVAGYITGMLPFWIRLWIRNYIPVPYLLAVLASIAAVATVEPTMFIGFALLYLRTSKMAIGEEVVSNPQFAR